MILLALMEILSEDWLIWEIRLALSAFLLQDVELVTVLTIAESVIFSAAWDFQVSRFDIFVLASLSPSLVA